MKPRVSRGSLLDDLAHRSHELARLGRAQEPGERLFEDLVAAEAEELGHRIVRDEDLAV